MRRSARAPVRTHSSAWPLAAAWALLIVYASLHPFAGWQGPVEAHWLERAWLARPSASRFDLWSNFLAYQPLGLLLAVGWLRGGHGPLRATLQAVAAAALLSLLMEWTQILLPMRVPSRIDLLLNTAGGLVGALFAAAAADLGLLRRWQRLRDRWLVPRSAAGLTLLLTWPIGLLFPPPVPLGLGEGLSRAGRALHEALQDSTLHAWLPVPAELVPLPPLLELTATTLGLLAPCWIAFVLAQGRRHRLVLLVGATLLGLGATTLSTALNFGPDHALTWVTPTLVPAVVIGLGAGTLVALLPARWIAALGLVGLTSLVALLAQAGTDPYFASSLQGWEQGRFIRFHGLARWVGWVWPYAALLYLLGRVADAAPLEAR